MSEKNEPLDKIIDNMTAEMQNGDGQYASLGFSTPPTEPQWNPSYNFNPYQPAGYVPIQPFAPSYTYRQPPAHYDLETFGLNYYDMNGEGIFPNLMHMERHVEPQPSAHTQFIENLVGNWVPTTSGTYSPFGNVEPFKPTPSVFEQIEKENEQILVEDKQFNFNRARRPRMVAEVKPMRPSYSDVLTKAVPPKVAKADVRETKQKKESGKKGGKSEKGQKMNATLSRSNTNADIRDIPVDKTAFIKTNSDKDKRIKNTQLHRKWASLDNINEPINDSKVEEGRKKKSDDVINNNKNLQKSSFRKVGKNESVDNEASCSRSETFCVNKNGIKKTKFNGRSKTSESFSGNERPAGKRNQRIRKRENNVFFGIAAEKLKNYLKNWWKILTIFLMWLLHLISDICSLSIHISRDMACNFWLWSCVNWALFVDTLIMIIKRVRVLSWLWDKIKKPEKAAPKENNRSFLHSGLQNNINMPTTGDEAMKRLLACKGKDPYSILGVTPTCTDDDIKRYYKRQAVLVHPDKNQQPGAEEAFKILVHAFDMIGEPERRAAYDKGVVESVQVEQAWSELNDLLTQLQQKVEAAANTIRCSACGLRHRRVKVERPSYAARNCASCRIHHAAREGDIWAEARCFGLLWHYYACMEGSVYDITEWAGCQKDSLKHLKPDSHQVQYRIALGQQQQQRRHSGAQRQEKPPDLENLLNTLYGQQDLPGKRKSKKK